ncbi:hypothetical protein AAZX31_02G118500 [Glycine max]|uniref:Uncharacterized protein n=1 Tax=Glycine soja TaxID=3848 RepID=A0A445LP33_GLYSO|nr:hypothetical protein D0Y65_003735 [Glycine soja]
MSSDPPFFHKIISNAWKSIAIPTFGYEGNLPLSLPSIAIPTFGYEGNLPLSLPSIITRTRSLTLALPQNHGSEALPMYHFINATETEKLDYNPKKRASNLSAKIVCMIFAALANQTMSTPQNQPSILGPAIVIAFVASLFVMLVSKNDTIKPSYLRLVAIMEITGSLSFTLIFWLMTKPFFSGNLTLWIIMGVLAMAWNMLALCIRFST